MLASCMDAVQRYSAGGRHAGRSLRQAAAVGKQREMKAYVQAAFSFSF